MRWHTFVICPMSFRSEKLWKKIMAAGKAYLFTVDGSFVGGRSREMGKFERDRHNPYHFSVCTGKPFATGAATAAPVARCGTQSARISEMVMLPPPNVMTAIAAAGFSAHLPLCSASSESFCPFPS